MPCYKDEKTGTWYCQFRYADFTGKRKQKRKRGFKTKREAQEWEREFHLQKAKSLGSGPSARRRAHSAALRAGKGH